MVASPDPLELPVRYWTRGKTSHIFVDEQRDGSFVFEVTDLFDSMIAHGVRATPEEALEEAQKWA